MSEEKIIDKLETAFDAGEDMSDYFNFEKPMFPNREPKQGSADLQSMGDEANESPFQNESVQAHTR